MSGKINVGNAKVVGDDIEINLNIDELLEALDLEEVQMLLSHFVGKGAKKRRSIKLFAAKLSDEYANKYQTHSLRIDTYFRPKS